MAEEFNFDDDAFDQALQERRKKKKEKSKAKDYGEVNEGILVQAERLLFDNPLDEDKHKELMKLINKKFHKTGQVALCKINKDFDDFCNKNHLNYEKNEVILKAGNLIFYSDNDHYRPTGFEQPLGLSMAVSKILMERQAKAKKKAKKQVIA